MAAPPNRNATAATQRQAMMPDSSITRILSPCCLSLMPMPLDSSIHEGRNAANDVASIGTLYVVDAVACTVTLCGGRR